ncbi:ComEC/Rec2 family competence protein [Cryobacterium sp. MLB-32]|uniref:ComEC/Rec2 family competence protein n=1 Tax=Cryobacterium sp. MLB-32 TaxID=1529318 RepID=UPI00068A79B6|nr:ComEC/Rec2 family competence protein [Cryobacterium sp. MLB-32]
MSHDLRLVAPAAAAWLTSGILIAVPDLSVPAAVACWIVAVASLGTMLVIRRPRWRTLCGALVVCGAVAGLVAVVVGVTASARLPASLRDAASGHQTVTITATVWSVPVPARSFGRSSSVDGGSARFRATIASISHRGDTTMVSVPIVAFAPTPVGSSRTLAIGSTVRLIGTPRVTDPGDSAAALFFSHSRAEVVAEAPWTLSWANDLRSGFSVAAATLPGEGADLLPGLAIGDTSAVTPELNDAMKSSALSHLTAVSGANCAIVIASIMLLGAVLGLRRWARIALSLAALLGFAILVTPEPSVLRSAVMASVTLVSIGIGRPGRGVATLGLSVVILLVSDPWLSRNYGFALSVLATAGLLVIAGPLARALSRWMPTALALIISIPFAAQLACQPVLLLLNPSIALYGVPANLLAAPAAPIATVIGLIGCLLLPVLPGVARGLIAAAWAPSEWIAAVATTSAALPGNRLPWLEGFAGFLLLSLGTILAIALLLRRRDGRRRRWPAAVLAVLLAGGGGYAGSLAGAGLGRTLAFPDRWQIAACDIGQGDAVLVRDGEQYALIDVGPDPALLTECLEGLHVARINLLVLTHYDLDHVGGLDAVIGRVDHALVGIPENAQDAGLHERLAAGGADVRQSARGDSGSLGSLAWRILWPVSGSTRMQTGNPGSVTIEFEGGGLRSIFLGDLGEEAQDALLRASPPGSVDVVKVAHHGSSDQSAALYETLAARVGLISVGSDNTYGHPTQRLLDILRGVGTEIERTDLEGLVVVARADDGALSVWSERVASADRLSQASARGG